jgi:hypothetical protein
MKQLNVRRRGNRSYMNPAEAAPIIHFDYLCAFCEVSEDEILAAMTRLRSRSWMAFVRMDQLRVRAQVPLFMGEDGTLGMLWPGGSKEGKYQLSSASDH